MFIYRPEYYKFEAFEDNTPSEGLADIMIEKNRHGSGGNIRVRFQSQYTKFTDVDDVPHFTEGGDSSNSGNFADPAAGIAPSASFSTFNASFNDEPETNFTGTDDGEMPF